MISTKRLTERLLYILLVIMFVLNMLLLAQVVAVGHRLDSRAAASKQNTQDTRALVVCIAKFFNQPNRVNKTITTIDSCNINGVR